MTSKAPSFAIVGLGLMGGSLAAAIRKRFPSSHVIAVSRNARSIRLAKKKRFIHGGFTTIGTGIQKADIIFICSPVDTIPKLIRAVDAHAKRGAIVTDVGSTKGEIVRWASRFRFERIEFIGSHPLAGSHLTGLKNAKGDLWKNAVGFVTPTRATSPRALDQISAFWGRLGLAVRVSPADLHDRIVSQISHLPHAVASVLMHAVSWEFFPFGATGFRDTTRVALGDPRLWTPIFLTNRKHLLDDLSRFDRALHRLISLLRKPAARSLRRFLETASGKRAKLKEK